MTSCSRARAPVEPGKSVASSKQRFTTQARRTRRWEFAATPQYILGDLASWRFKLHRQDAKNAKKNSRGFAANSDLRALRVSVVHLLNPAARTGGSPFR